MRFTSHKSNLLSLSVLLAMMAGLAAAEEKSGEAGGAKPSAEISKEQREFTEKQTKLNALQNRLVDADKKFKELVNEKAEAKTTESKQQIIKEMVELTNQRNKDAAEFNQIKSDLTYRYPNQGEHLERRYQTQSKRSVEEMEGAAGLDEMLTHTKKLIDKKYAPFMPEEDGKAAPKATSVQIEEKPARLRLEK